MTPTDDATGLRRRAASGLGWTSLEAVASRLITTAVFVVLARLLAPAEFGLVALSLVFIALCRLLVDQGFGTAIVQRAQLTKAHLDTAFWITLVTGLLLAGLLAGLAVPLSRLLGSPGLAPVLQVLSLAVAMTAPSSPATAVLRRNFAFRQLALRRLLSAVLGGVVGVSAALAGAGVWALVAQSLVQVGVATVLLWVATPYRPGLQVSRAAFRELFSYGNKVTGMTFVNFLSRRADDLLIGTVLGATALGLYAVAYRVLTIMNEVLVSTVETVSLTTFSKVQADLDRLRRGYEAAISSTTAIAAPAYVTVAVLAPDIILTFFGPRWSESIPVMQALALAGLAQALTASSQQVLLAVGRPSSALQLSLLYAVVNVVGFAIAVQFGILAVALAFTVRAYVLAPFSVRLVKQSIDISWGRWLLLLLPALLTAGVSGGVLLLARAFVFDELLSPVRLALGLLLGGLVYLAVFRVAFPARFREVASAVLSVLPARGRRRPRTAAPSQDDVSEDAV